MKRMYVAAAVLLALVLVVAMACGCGSSDDSNNDTIEGNMTGESMDVEAGEEFEVELESNPTTGFEWTITTEPDSAVVESMGSEFVEPDSSAVGAPGTEVFKFKGIAPGKTTIVLEYARPWEEDMEPDQVHTVSVQVTE